MDSLIDRHSPPQRNAAASVGWAAAGVMLRRQSRPVDGSKELGINQVRLVGRPIAPRQQAPNRGPCKCLDRMRESSSIEADQSRASYDIAAISTDWCGGGVVIHFPVSRVAMSNRQSAALMKQSVEVRV